MANLALLLSICAILPAVIYTKSILVNNPAHSPNFEELGPYTEGDLILTEDQKNGIIGDNYRWPNATIYYSFEGTYATNATEQKPITDAISDYTAKTCIRFVPYSGIEVDYVAITDAETGCFSNVGRIGGRQTLNLELPGCNWVEIAIHELMHAAGFFHEQSRPDRDSFVTINWENIETGREYNFEIRETALTFDESYDYGSIMHYTRFAFSGNGLETITPKDASAEIGQSYEMSSVDAAKLNAMYGCKKQQN